MATADTATIAGSARGRRGALGNPKIAIGYIRASTDEQALGPEAQRRLLLEWCTRQGCQLAEVFEDLGVSGGAEVHRRPGLVAALGALAPAGAGVFLTAKRDRLARDSFSAVVIERAVERSGAVVQTADGVANGEGPEATLLRRVLDAFSEYERLLIATRTRAALAVKKGRGERVGGIPYGYRLDYDGIHLIKNEHEQEVIRRLCELRKGSTLRELAAHCQREGIRARHANWSAVTLSRLFRRVTAEQ